MAKKRLLWLSISFRILVCVVLVVASLGIFAILKRTKVQPARSTGANAAVAIEVLAARPVPVYRQWIGYGTARAQGNSDVPARVTATVASVGEGVDEGNWVEQGQLLVQLDDIDFREQIEIADRAIDDINAQLEQITIDKASWTRRRDLATELVQLAEAEFERLRVAFERDAAKQREVDTTKQALIASIRDEVGAQAELDRLGPLKLSLEAKLLQVQAERRLAGEGLARCRITSPLAGVLQAVDVEVGESLIAGARVARVVDLRHIEVPLRLPSGARSHIRVGDDVVLRLTDSQRGERRATVSRIAPEEDAIDRTVGVYVELEQDPRGDDLIAPGQFLRGEVVSARAEDRWLVPRRAMDGDRVRLVENGRIRSRPVDVAFQLEGEFPELGLPDDEWVVLEDPLPDGALVVVTASRALPDGLAVRPLVAGDGHVADLGDGEAAP